jgi:hypothetical protein
MPTVDEPSRYRDLMMPRRRQTREQNRRDRINAERRERTELIAEEERQRQAGSPPTTNHHRFDAVAMFSATGLSP